MNIEKIIEEYFPPPLDVLLTLQDPRKYEAEDVKKQSDYLEMTGLTEEHIPHMIKIMDLWFDDTVGKSDDMPLILAPVHAWRLLGQLKSEQAIEPLLSMLDRMSLRGEDWFLEEYPYVFRNIGAKALLALKQYLAEEHELFAHVCAAHCIKEIGLEGEETRGHAIQILRDKLEAYDNNDETLNAFLISYLVKLKAVESAELIEHAFAAYAVDCSIGGDWGKIKRKLGVEGLGLAPEREPSNFLSPSPLRNNSLFPVAQKDRNKAKAKREKAKNSRKKNRKKKK